MVGLLGLALWASYAHVLEPYELQTYDWRCQLRGDRPISKDIVFVDIWDDALTELGAWPFSRLYHAELIKVLSKYGAKAVGFDVLFVEPREGDEEMAQAAQKAKNVYFVYGFSDLSRVNGTYTSTEILSPMLPEYADAAKGIGHVNPKPDIDGKIRRVFPTIRYEGRDYPHLGIKMAMDALGGRPLTLPLDDEGCFIVNYAGPWQRSFRHYSYLDILVSEQQNLSGLKPRIDLNELRGKYCLVGLTSLGSHDTKPIPIQSVYPMVGMHANVLNSIFENDFIYRLDRKWNLEILLILGLWLILFSTRARPLIALTAAISTMGVFTAVAVGLFWVWGWWIDLFFPLILSILIYSTATLSRAIFEMRKRQLMEKELAVASQIQKSFLPEAVPSHPALEVAVYMKPAKAVGGDLYNFVSLPAERLGVMVGDVSGKGTPAALFMAKAVSEFKFSAREKSDPAQVLSSMNDSVSSESTGGLFVTLCYAIFDVKNKNLEYSNGGHLPLVRVKASGECELLSGEEGMPIGVMPGVPFSTSTSPLEAGDCLAFYSDGVTEARNRKAQEFSVETLQQVMAENRSKTCQGILEAVIHRLNRFMGLADQHDDITLVLVKVESPKQA